MKKHLPALCLSLFFGATSAGALADEKPAPEKIGLRVTCRDRIDPSRVLFDEYVHDGFDGDGPIMKDRFLNYYFQKNGPSSVPRGSKK